MAGRKFSYPHLPIRIHCCRLRWRLHHVVHRQLAPQSKSLSYCGHIAPENWCRQTRALNEYLPNPAIVLFHKMLKQAQYWASQAFFSSRSKRSCNRQWRYGREEDTLSGPKPSLSSSRPTNRISVRGYFKINLENYVPFFFLSFFGVIYFILN